MLQHSSKGEALGSAWRTREHGIPFARYIDRDFAALEGEKLWPHVWQMACRTDELRNPGDYVVYEILKHSVVLVRTGGGAIKAYLNVCPHRATALAMGSGRFQLETIVCPYHGWKWNLEGENTHVLDRGEFQGGCLTDEEIALTEVRLAQWMGSVWINLDNDAPPFEEHIAPIKALIDPILIENMRFYWHKSIRFNANWKVAQEAFMEAYHVPTSHPQVMIQNLKPTDYTDSIDYKGYENGHGVFYFARMSTSVGRILPDKAATLTKAEQVESFITAMRLSSEGIDAMILEDEIAVARTMIDRDIPEGSLVGFEFQR